MNSARWLLYISSSSRHPLKKANFTSIYIAVSTSSELLIRLTISLFQVQPLVQTLLYSLLHIAACSLLPVTWPCVFLSTFVHLFFVLNIHLTPIALYPQGNVMSSIFVIDIYFIFITLFYLTSWETSSNVLFSSCILAYAILSNKYFKWSTFGLCKPILVSSEILQRCFNGNHIQQIYNTSNYISPKFFRTFSFFKQTSIILKRFQMVDSSPTIALKQFDL